LRRDGAHLRGAALPQSFYGAQIFSRLSHDLKKACFGSFGAWDMPSAFERSGATIKSPWGKKPLKGARCFFFLCRRHRFVSKRVLVERFRSWQPSSAASFWLRAAWDMSLGRRFSLPGSRARSLVAYGATAQLSLEKANLSSQQQASRA
jgi:hypothetical protein